MYSQYRANKLRVTLIFNKFDPFDIVEYIYNTNYHKSIKYEINKIVEEDDYNMDLNKIYTSGIHYFKTIEAAFY
jgi:hypothetical protein